MSKSKIMDNKTVGMIGRFLNENAPTLAIGGAIGTLVGALWAAFKASQEVTSAREKYDKKVQQIESEAVSEDEKALKIKDAKSERNVKYVMAYKWVGLMGAASIALMITANALNGAKIATLTTLAIANQDKLKKLAENGKSLIAEEPWKKVEDKTLEDILSEQFFGEDGPKAKRLNAKDGELFILFSPDFMRATLFQSMEEDVKYAIENAERYYRNNGNLLSEDKFDEFLGFVPDPSEKSDLYWTPEQPFKVHIESRNCLGGTFKCLQYDISPVKLSSEQNFYKAKAQQLGGKA